MQKVTGGFHHRMWRLETDRACFAVKQLSADTDLQDAELISHYNLSECLAKRFCEAGVPALHALETDGTHLQVMGNEAYLVYPWTEARALRRREISPGHVEQVARIFAKMHCLDLQLPLIDLPFEVMSEEKLNTLLAFAHSRNSSRRSELEENLPLFVRAARRHGEAAQLLSDRRVVSHGDLDHKNILWQTPTAPLLIDWESSRRLNPTHEVILEGLDWSGVTLDFQEEIFEGFISTYLRAGGIASLDEVEAALHCVVGDWLNWLMYNVGRSIDIDDPQQRQIGSEQVDHALVILQRLERLLPRLLRKVRHPVASHV